jgi:hypothetical protein
MIASKVQNSAFTICLQVITFLFQKCTTTLYSESHARQIISSDTITDSNGVALPLCRQSFLQHSHVSHSKLSKLVDGCVLGVGELSTNKFTGKQTVCRRQANCPTQTPARSAVPVRPWPGPVRRLSRAPLDTLEDRRASCPPSIKRTKKLLTCLGYRDSEDTAGSFQPFAY